MATIAGIFNKDTLISAVWNDGYIYGGVGDVLLNNFNSPSKLSLIENKFHISSVFIKKRNNPHYKFINDNHLLYDYHGYQIKYITYGEGDNILIERLKHKDNKNNKWKSIETPKLKLQFLSFDYSYVYFNSEWQLRITTSIENTKPELYPYIRDYNNKYNFLLIPISFLKSLFDDYESENKYLNSLY